MGSSSFFSTLKIVSVCLVALSTQLPLARAQFRALPTYSTDNVQLGAQPQGVVSADFNGDGKPDLVVANSAGHSVAILLNNGDGTFQPAVAFSTPAQNGPRSIVAADFNGDGKMDIATAGTGCCGGQVAVFLGNGDGTFQQGVLYWPLGIDAGTIRAVDVNGDGKPDLVMGSDSSTGLIYGQLYVLLGNGDGSFQSPIVTTLTILGANPDVVVGDFNHDSKPDVAMEVSGELVVLLGNGDGTFGAPTTYLGSDDITSLAVGDMNHDGNLDVIAGTSANLDVFLGNADGTFQPAVVSVSSQSGAGVGAVAVGDLNGDGKLDVILAPINVGSVGVLFGNGTAHLGPEVVYAVGSGPSVPGAIWAADLNGDGYIDVVCTNDSDATLSILFGSQTGRLPSPIVTPVFSAGPMVAGDFNKDGNLDVAAVRQGGNWFMLFLGNGKGRLLPPTDVAAVAPMSIAAADFNGDGNLDVATGNGKNLSVFFGKGNGTFYTPVNYGAGSNLGNRNSFIAALDLNGDGKADLAVITQPSNAHPSVIAIMLNNGIGGFLPAVQYTLSGSPLNLAFADFNGDGKLDMAACDVNNYISVFLGHGDGTFGTPTDYSVICSQVISADVNGDGKPDLLLANGYLGVMLGNGDGTFQTATFNTTVFTTGVIAAADFNRDGKIDIAADGPDFGVYYGNGDGTFTYTGYGLYDPGFVVGNFNGDNRPDMAIFNNGGVFVLLNTGGKSGATEWALQP
jgi:hypothetical protein